MLQLDVAYPSFDSIFPSIFSIFVQNFADHPFLFKSVAFADMVVSLSFALCL